MSYYRYKATISYDGYNYYGFERQGNLPTIELALTTAFINWLGQEIKVVGSGRTDKLVHAYGQVIHFDLTKALKPETIQKALNSFLPLDIRIMAVEAVDITFHARFSAKKKEYHYKITTKANDVFSLRYAYYCYNLDLSLMQEAANYLIGTHNFRSFCSIHTNQLKDFTRTIYAVEIEKNNDLIVFKFLGSSFLKYQVRRMMGVLIEIGKGRYSTDFIKELLAKEDSRACQYIAPGQGLYLVKVYY